MNKQIKTTTPTNADLKGSPMIGGDKGTTASGSTPDGLEADLGANTIEGDTANDTNAFGGIDKDDGRGGRGHGVSDPPRPGRR